MDVDKVLGYEQECYDKGYAEGHETGRKLGHIEGRELGIQTGFLRYLPMGVLQARVRHWQNEGVNSEALSQLTELVSTPVLSNDTEVVEALDLKLKLAKNKCRSVATTTKSPPVDAHEQKIAYQRDADGMTAIEDIF